MCVCACRYNLFADPDIIRLPDALRSLQRPLAALISTLRAPKSAEGYAAIGGSSPLRATTEEQVCVEIYIAISYHSHRTCVEIVQTERCVYVENVDDVERACLWCVYGS